MSRLATIAGVPGQTPRPPLPGRPPTPTQSPPISSTGQTSYTSGFHTRPASDPGAMTGGTGGYNTNVQAVMPDMSDFEPFREAVFDQFERDIQPQIEQRRARLNQDLVNRGITPGSEAYEREMTRFMQMENDAFSGAQRSALESALAAQGQFFNQGLGQAQVNAGLAQARMGADASRYGSMMGARASMYGADQGRDGALERLLLNLGEQGRQFNMDYGLRDRGMSLNERTGDVGNLGSLANIFLGLGGFNNAALDSDFNRAGGLMGLLPSAPVNPINVGNAYGVANQAGAANARLGGQQQAGMFGAIGSLGSALIPFLSDRNVKHDVKAVDNGEVLEKLRSVPVSRWKYNGDDREHIGPMAQDFGAAVTDDPDATVIHGVDAFGSMLSAIQALADRVDELEAANAG